MRVNKIRCWNCRHALSADDIIRHIDSWREDATPVKDRIWQCRDCDAEHDRRIEAAMQQDDHRGCEGWDDSPINQAF